MKFYMLPLMLVCFMTGMVLDMTLSRVVIDTLFIATMAGTIVTSFLIMRYPRPAKKSIPRSQSKVAKSHKTSGRSLSKLNR